LYIYDVPYKTIFGEEVHDRLQHLLETYDVGDHGSSVDFSESFLASLAVGIGDNNSSSIFPEGITITTDPKEADLLLVPIPGFLLCTAAGWGKGEPPPKWAENKMVMSVPCEAYRKVLTWVEQTRFFKDNTKSAKRHLIYFNTWMTDKFPDAGKYERRSFAEYVSKSPLLSRALILTEEDRTNTRSKFITVPYYLGSTWTSHLGKCDDLRSMQSRQRPHLAAFVGSLVEQTLTKNKCPHCPNGQNGHQIRVKLVQSLSRAAGSEVLLSVFGMSDNDQSKLTIREREALRQSQQLSDEEIRKVMLDSTFCIIPRGDTASSRRFYCAILTLCIPVVVSDHFDFPFQQDPLVQGLYQNGVIQIKEHDVVHDPSFDTLEVLRKIDAQEIHRRQSALLELQPFVSFYKPFPIQDACPETPTAGIGMSATAALLREAAARFRENLKL
jgi:hypothetical protein